MRRLDKILLLDGSKLATIEAFHDALSRGLHFPDYYGRNLDALYDCLTDYSGSPLNIHWTSIEDSLKLLGERTTSALLSVFKDAAAQNPCLTFTTPDSA
ncbi:MULTISPECIES: barstar family protein [unclassified Paenibacillus]|uniref:barstar family protein n=1 Tax=unclassified Paenibacillus TaxID=185978 RepID=UPI0009544DDB|nr:MULTISPECIES: barstar family protein [unclassified Paenibacillus]ASS64962.1 barstar family protein [Paenibacillus sp. RUD330]SIQ99803.1 ribonuclease inhibitor [Paenibacillus sp. RU4X]SIR34919.1 ribonuclease inhibitor [Paenibacillus sp. RU4T]